jgi:hypothetical protein
MNMNRRMLLRSAGSRLVNMYSRQRVLQGLEAALYEHVSKQYYKSMGGRVYLSRQEEMQRVWRRVWAWQGRKIMQGLQAAFM